MVKEYSRSQRLSQEIHKEIALILQRKIRDPHIGMTTVSSVKISHDLAYAKIFVTFFHHEISDLNKDISAQYGQIKTSIRKLQDASGFIRKLLSKTIQCRIVPELIFIHDKSLREGMRISNLITHAIKNDHFRHDTEHTMK